MASGRRKPAESQEEGAPAWMNTYGDMVTLLLTFFVLLFSFSTVDASKWKAIVQSFTGKVEASAPQLSLNPNTDMDELILALGTPAPTPMGDTEDEQRFDELYRKIKNHVQENGLDNALDVSKENGTIIIRVMDSALFDSGQDRIRQDALIMLDNIISIFDQYDDAIREIHVEGHTDNVPISSSRFKSNWDLSTSRAVSVIQYCIERSRLNPMKYAAAGYGEYHPVADNSTEEGKAKNRRVDFVLMSMKSIDLSGTS
jgi:chemotaxis protein MotB